MRISRMKTLFILLGAIIIAILALPLFGLFFKQFAFDAVGFTEILADQAALKAVGLSCLSALLAVVACFVFGVPLAYLLARKEFRGKAVVSGLIDLPMVIPHAAAGIMLLTVFGLNGLVGGPLSPFIRFEGAMPGVVVAMMFVSAPFFLNSAKEGFQSVDPRLEKVARSLGASEWTAFRKVALPLAAPQIFTGAIMGWSRAVSEFAAVTLLVGFYPMIAPGMIWSRFNSLGFYQGMRVAVLLLVITLSVFIFLKYLQRRLYAKH